MRSRFQNHVRIRERRHPPANRIRERSPAPLAPQVRLYPDAPHELSRSLYFPPPTLTPCLPLQRKMPAGNYSHQKPRPDQADASTIEYPVSATAFDRDLRGQSAHSPTILLRTPAQISAVDDRYAPSRPRASPREGLFLSQHARRSLPLS